MHERCGMVSERGLLHMGNAKERIESGKAVLGIEFGSTRIKAVLVDETHQPIASGAHDWENQLVDGIWTYSLDMIWDGLRDCYRKMTEDVQNKYGVAVTKLGAIGFSGMMHGYMPFDEKGGASGSVPHLEKYHHGRGCRSTDEGVLVQYSAALEHRTSVSGDLKRGRACG